MAGFSSDLSGGAASSELRRVAFFDFDGTLIKGDSMWPFLKELAGGRRCWVALGRALLFSLFSSNRRTRVKEILLRDLLRGVRVDDLGPSVEALKKWVVWVPDFVEKLRAHHAAGDRVVIASGSLDVYLPALLEGLPYDDLICTEIGQVDGVLTGEMREGNCVRLRKAERVGAYLAAKGPFGESFGYGNPPHDAPMVSLLTHGVLVPIAR